MKSFNNIVKALRKTITKLDTLVSSNGAETIKISGQIDSFEEAIAGAQRSIGELNAEGQRAQETASKLRALIGE